MPKFDDTKHEKRLEELYHKEEEELMRALSGKYGHQYMNLNGVSIDTDALKIVDEAQSREAELALFAKNNKKLRVAVRNPNKKEAQDVIASLNSRGYETELFIVSTQSLEHAWARYQDIKRAAASQKGVFDIEADAVAHLSETIQTNDDVKNAIEQVASKKGTREVSETLEVILGGALALRASDVHIEPEESTVRLRFRLDGVLSDVTDIKRETYKLLRSRVKLLSGLKINITDRAQDGRFTIDIDHKNLEIRSSVIPGTYGESIVMRVLDPSTIILEMEKLGINPKLFEIIKKEISRPNGMIVTTGPTGSGKTTSLYAFLRRIHTPGIKIVTLEDPVEYHLEGIVQTQIDKEYTFTSGLRAILRQDPDVIMVGEIRDREVAETAINAALTGHLVFSTLHTNNAVGTFPRLIDLGVDSRMIGNAINLALAQRLIRVLCDDCKEAYTPPKEETDVITSVLKSMDNAPSTDNLTLYRAVGCEKCSGTGYRGRIGIYEGILVDKAVEDAVISDPRESTILKAAEPQGIPSMQQDGITKLLAGTISFEELGRVIDLYDRRASLADDTPNQSNSSGAGQETE